MSTKQKKGEKFLPFINRWLYENLGLHRHAWRNWSEASTSTIYHQSITRAKMEDAIPVKYELKQRRACLLCKLLETRTIPQ